MPDRMSSSSPATNHPNFFAFQYDVLVFLTPLVQEGAVPTVYINQSFSWHRQGESSAP